ncbi:hypothetical protein M9458_042913, partial [Cirrhinus mrigala]
ASSRHVRSPRVSPDHVSSAASIILHHYPSLVSSLRDAPLMAACSTGIPKPTHLTAPVPELFPPSAALHLVGITLWCVWATYTTTESPEVAAYAAESLEVAASTVASSAAMMPATVSPEVAAEAAEPHKTGTSALATCMVVAPSDIHPDYGSSFCPVPAMEATYELSAPPVTAMEAATELFVHPAPAMEATYELSAPPVTAEKPVYELSVFPVPALEAIYKLLSCPEPIYKPSTCSVPTETAIKPTAFPVSLL